MTVRESDRIVRRVRSLVALSALLFFAVGGTQAEIGREVAVTQHLEDGDELEISVEQLVEHGQRVFGANWTIQEGAGRPQTKGTGGALADSADPLLFPRNFNRVSAPDANSCAGCHNIPRSGGGGDVVANVFVLGQRFDFATFDGADPIPTKGAVDESGTPTRLQTIANSRNTLGMFGSGFIEMLARQMTAEMRAIRDAIGPGGSAQLLTKGVSFGSLSRNLDGTWDTSLVEGLPAGSTSSTGANNPPSLVIAPFHQAGAVISLRQFTNNAFNHHHGIQTSERFGDGLDPDQDGFVDEMTRADVTAASIFQAQLAVPGRVIPRDPQIEAAVLSGESLFEGIGCTSCHVRSLQLTDQAWLFTEPNPFNPAGNLQVGQSPTYSLDLTDENLDLPRLAVEDGVVHVEAFTDLKLHDITAGPSDPNREPLNMHHAAGSAAFFAGNSRFLTRKLWGAANEPPYFHHGQYTTMREAIGAHAGEAQAATDQWNSLSEGERDAIIEFLKTLQVLPPGTAHRVVDENFQPRSWPPDGDDDDESDDESGSGKSGHIEAEGRNAAASEGILELSFGGRAPESDQTENTKQRADRSVSGGRSR